MPLRSAFQVPLITDVHMRLLAWVEEHDAQAAPEVIAASFGVKPETISALLRDLVEAEMLHQERDSAEGPASAFTLKN